MECFGDAILTNMVVCLVNTLFWRDCSLQLFAGRMQFLATRLLGAHFSKHFKMCLQSLVTRYHYINIHISVYTVMAFFVIILNRYN